MGRDTYSVLLPKGINALATDLATQTVERLLCKLKRKFIHVEEKKITFKEKR